MRIMQRNCNHECDAALSGHSEGGNFFPENPNVLGFKDMETSSPDYEYEATLETQVAIRAANATSHQGDRRMRLTGTLDSQRSRSLRRKPPCPVRSMQLIRRKPPAAGRISVAA